MAVPSPSALQDVCPIINLDFYSFAANKSFRETNFQTHDSVFLSLSISSSFSLNVFIHSLDISSCPLFITENQAIKNKWRIGTIWVKSNQWPRWQPLNNLSGKTSFVSVVLGINYPWKWSNPKKLEPELSLKVAKHCWQWTAETLVYGRRWICHRTGSCWCSDGFAKRNGLLNG